MSASNDAAQLPHDMREQILKGAELAAAGRSLGLSEEETLAAVSRQYRRQARSDDQVTAMDVMRQMAQSANTAVTDVGAPEIKGVGYAGEDDVAFAFGEDVEYNQANRKSGATRADDEQTYRENDRGFTVDPESGLVRRETFEETKGDPVDVAPRSVLVDALKELDAAAEKQKSGVGGSIARVFGGSGVDAETDRAIQAIREQLTPDRQLDARLGRVLVRQDNDNYNYRRAAYNNIKAELEADAISRRGYDGSGLMNLSDENLGRIGTITRLGKGREDAQVVPVMKALEDLVIAEAARRSDGVYIDPATGNTIAVQGPEEPEAIAGRRVPLSTNPANVPGVQTAADFINATAPGYREGNSFGDYPQVNITRETTNFSNALRDRLAYLGVPVQSNPNIRSLDELDAAARFYSKTMQEKGKTSMVRNPETGKTSPAGPQIISGMMDDLRLSPGSQSNLANALYQVDAARRSQVNQNPTGTYLSRATKQGPEMMGTASRSFDPSTGQYGSQIRFDSPEAMVTDGVATPIGRQKKGSKIEGKDIVAELRKLSNSDAAIPLIGQTAERPSNPLSSFMGEQVYNRTGLTDESQIKQYLTGLEQSRSRKSGKPVDQARLANNIVNATAVARRAGDAQTKNAQRMSQIISSLPPVARRSIYPRGSR